MSQRLIATSILATIYLAGLYVGAPMAAEPSSTIVIKTTTKQGQLVSAAVKMKKGDGDWVALSAVRGVVTVTVDPCDSTVSFMAANVAGQGIYTRENPDTPISCTSPEVVFADYVLALEAWMALPDRMTQSDAWIAALGGDDLARELGPEYAKQLSMALKTGDAGYVAIGTAEIAAALRKAGKYEDAKIFTTLSLEASMAGIVDRTGAYVEKDSLFFRESREYGYVLSSEGAEILKQYQMKDLGLTTDSNEAGKIGWKTMKSLMSDDKEPVAEFKLPADAIGKFDSKVFLYGG
jgi:hypothetical protein